MQGKITSIQLWVQRFLDVQLLCWFRGRRSDDGYCEIKEKKRSQRMHYSALGVAAVSF